ncbi:MAG TPA: hypothetical protein VE597_03100 [Geminicoccaceae bacterium]|jgi:hypothetical protein|nr:hypothetical protein [Geminicoccaceae bacterium]
MSALIGSPAWRALERCASAVASAPVRDRSGNLPLRFDDEHEIFTRGVLLTIDPPDRSGGPPETELR